jgi:hypothetical protein
VVRLRLTALGAQRLARLSRRHLEELDRLTQGLLEPSSDPGRGGR